MRSPGVSARLIGGILLALGAAGIALAWVGGPFVVARPFRSLLAEKPAEAEQHVSEPTGLRERRDFGGGEAQTQRAHGRAEDVGMRAQRGREHS